MMRRDKMEKELRSHYLKIDVSSAPPHRIVGCGCGWTPRDPQAPAPLHEIGVDADEQWITHVVYAIQAAS